MNILPSASSHTFTLLANNTLTVTSLGGTTVTGPNGPIATVDGTRTFVYPGDTVITLTAAGNDCIYGTTEPENAKLTKDASGNVTGLVGADGKKTRFQTPRNALRTVVCGNSIAGAAKFSTYISTKSIPHWGNIFGGSPFRFTRIKATTRADLHGVYSYSGATLATINADLSAQLIDPVNTAGWFPECVIGIGLLENSIVGGTSVAALKAEFNHWRRLMQTVWPGVMLVTHTPLPSFSYNTGAMVAAYAEMRDWLRSEDDGVSLLVFDGDTYENTASPGTPLAGYTDASVHPHTNAASMLGRNLARTMKRISSNWVQPALAKSNNPALSGTGAATGVNVTGTVATSFTFSGSANGTFVAKAEQPGQLVAVTANSGAGPALVDLGTSNGGSITITEAQVSAFAELEIVSGAENIHVLQLEPRFGDDAGNVFRYFMQHQTNDYKPVFENGDILTFVQPPQIANSAPFYGCINYIRHNAILAGGTFSYRVRKQGAIVLASNTQVLNYAVAITPNVALGTNIIIEALTGNITVNAPINPSVGAIITLNFTSDATIGRTITYNAVFKTSAVPASTANGKASHMFFYDGANWVQTGGALVWL